MRDDLRTLIDVLRVDSTDLPDGFAAAPILDEWRFRLCLDGSLTLAGCCSGDERFPPGAHIVTSDVTQIDGRSSIRWARTRNTLYRLGAPIHDMSLIAAVALMNDWTDALTLLALLTGEHTLGAAALETCTKLLGLVDSQDWDEKRSLSCVMASAMSHAGRSALRDAWALLGADPRNRNIAVLMRDMLVAEPDQGENDKVGPVIAAWRAFAEGDIGYLHDHDQDHIAAAHRVGRLIIEDRTFGSGEFDEPRPLLVRMALKRTWGDAAHLLLDECDSVDSARAHLLDLMTSEWLMRRRAARIMADRLRANGDDRADCFRLLAVDPLNPADAMWVHQRLCEFIIPGKSREEDTARAGWWRLVLGHYPKDADADQNDPIATAWAAAADVKLAALVDDLLDVAAPSATAAEPCRVIVLASIGGTTKSSSGREVEQEFRSIVGEQLQLVPAFNLAHLRTALDEEFPHLTDQIGTLLTGLVEGEPVHLAPTLLVGEPGGGKSRLARRFAGELGVPLHRFDGAGSADNAFGGTPRRWSSGEHCVPLEAVRRGKVANPCLLVDEIDKAGTSRHNGSLVSALLPFLEPENARAYPDPYVQSECDLSHVNYCLTANETTALPSAFRDRLRIVVLPQPSIEHLPQLARTIVLDIAKSRGGDPRWYPALEDHELAIAEELWRGGSVRRLRAIVERLLAHREQNPRN